LIAVVAAMDEYTIRTLAEGEKLTEPGFYGITLDQHHNQPCDGPSVTSGVLRAMELSTPADVWAFSKLNPDRWEKPETTALRLGRAMAAYVEGGMDAVGEEYLIIPKDAPRRPTTVQIAAFEKNGKWSEAAAPGAAFWEKIDADGRTPLSEAEITMIDNMGKVLADDPIASVLMGGIPEVSMAWKDQRTGLWCLARPDVINFDGTTVDYKKQNTQGRPFNHRIVDAAITKYGYDMQLGFANEGFEQLTGDWPTMAAIVAQCDAPPHHVIAREIAEEDLRIGQFRNRRSLDRFAECLASGNWPGPGVDVACYQRPEWQRTMLLEEMQIQGTAT
jgi:hypothetical protein